MINCQICEHNPTGDKCELFGRVIGMHGCSSAVERKPRNHFEMLKAMSMEELAFELAQSGCPAEREPLRADCVKCWLEWLKEATE